MKYSRNNFDQMFQLIQQVIKTKVIAVGSYGREALECGDLDVCIELTQNYSGSDALKDLLNVGFYVKRFKDNDGAEVWLQNKMCHVIFFSKTDYILKITRFLEGKHNVYNLYHRLYIKGYIVNANTYEITNNGNKIILNSLKDLEDILEEKIPYRDLIIKALNKYENKN